MTIPIGSMYGIYANIWGILMVNVTIYSIHGSYGIIIYYNKHKIMVSPEEKSHSQVENPSRSYPSEAFTTWTRRTLGRLTRRGCRKRGPKPYDNRRKTIGKP